MAPVIQVSHSWNTDILTWFLFDLWKLQHLKLQEERRGDKVLYITWILLYCHLGQLKLCQLHVRDSARWQTAVLGCCYGHSHTVSEDLVWSTTGVPETLRTCTEEMPISNLCEVYQLSSFSFACPGKCWYNNKPRPHALKSPSIIIIIIIQSHSLLLKHHILT